MPIPELQVKVISHLLSPATRNAFWVGLASQMMGAASPLERTLELTDRICDRYFPQ